MSERRYSRPASPAVEEPDVRQAPRRPNLSALTPSITYAGSGNLLESNKKWAFAHSSLPPIAGALTAVQTEQTRYPLPYAACRRNSNPPGTTRSHTPPELLQPAFNSRCSLKEGAESSCSSHRCRWKAAFKSSFFSCPDRCRRSRRTHPQSLHLYTLRLASRTSARTENLPPGGAYVRYHTAPPDSGKTPAAQNMQRMAKPM